MPTSLASEGALRYDPFLECRASGDSDWLGGCGESRSGLDRLLWALSGRRTPAAAFPFADLGVRGVKELEEEVDEEGRGAVGLEEAAVLTVLVGRAGEAFALLEDDGAGLAFVAAATAGGLAALITLVKLTLKAALCGRGLIGRKLFSAADSSRC